MSILNAYNSICHIILYYFVLLRIHCRLFTYSNVLATISTISRIVIHSLYIFCSLHEWHGTDAHNFCWLLLIIGIIVQKNVCPILLINYTHKYMIYKNVIFHRYNSILLLYFKIVEGWPVATFELALWIGIGNWKLLTKVARLCNFLSEEGVAEIVFLTSNFLNN